MKIPEHNLLTHCTVDRHFIFFSPQAGAIRNNPAVITLAHGLCWIFVPVYLRNIPKGGTAGWQGKHLFSFSRCCQMIFQRSCTNLHSNQPHKTATAEINLLESPGNLQRLFCGEIETPFARSLPVKGVLNQRKPGHENSVRVPRSSR